MGSPLLGASRLIVYLLWTIACMPVQVVALRLSGDFKARFPKFYHRVCAYIMGFRVEVVGNPSADRPVLFVSNHASYLDIIVLSSVIPGSFVAKSEVGQWPFFGTLARLQRTVFVERSRTSAVDQQRDSLQARLAAGDPLILFPEGTSSDGNRTLPFKSALFAAATPVNGTPLTVQPVSVTPVMLDGVPLGYGLRSVYAWYGDMTLVPHLVRVVGLGQITVRVEFHAPVTLDQFGSRKALADHCWREVAGGVERAVVGRVA